LSARQAALGRRGFSNRGGIATPWTAERLIAADGLHAAVRREVKRTIIVDNSPNWPETSFGVGSRGRTGRLWWPA
jgi:hypothetical protein